MIAESLLRAVRVAASIHLLGGGCFFSFFPVGFFVVVVVVCCDSGGCLHYGLERNEKKEGFCFFCVCVLLLLSGF
jgi:hypothetical protein